MRQQMRIRYHAMPQTNDTGDPKTRTAATIAPGFVYATASASASAAPTPACTLPGKLRNLRAASAAAPGASLLKVFAFSIPP